MPGQLTSYDSGGLEIFALRTMAEERLGDKFDLRQFHARILENGVLPLAAMQAVEPRIAEGVFSVLSVENSVKSRASYGGTAPQNVRKMARAWIKRLEKQQGRG